MNIHFDLSKLTQTGRILLSGLILCMPLAYILIFLYNKPFYNSHPYYISILFSYAISLGLLAQATALLAIIDLILYQKFLKELNKNLTLGIIFSIVVLIMFCVTPYRMNGSITFRKLIELIINSFTVWFVLYGIILLLIRIWMSKRKPSQLEIPFNDNDSE